MTEEQARRRWIWAGPAVCVAALSLLGYGPTRERSGADGLIAMFAAQGLVLGVVYVTMAGTVRRVTEAPAEQRLPLALRAGVIRFLLTLLVAAVIAWRAGLAQTPFLVWVAISYVVIINAETILLVRWMGTLGKGS